MSDVAASLPIRRAVPADAARVAAVMRTAFADLAPQYTPAAFRATTPDAEGVRTRMAEGPVWVVEDAAAVVATVAARTTPSGCYVRGMAVAPSARGAGLGRRLLEAVEAYARAHAAPRLYLSTTPFLHGAIHLYERFGFSRTEEPPHDLYGTPLFTMSLPLPPPSAR